MQPIGATPRRPVRQRDPTGRPQPPLGFSGRQAAVPEPRLRRPAADETSVRQSELDWTIVRVSGALTDGPLRGVYRAEPATRCPTAGGSPEPTWPIHARPLTLRATSATPWPSPTDDLGARCRRPRRPAPDAQVPGRWYDARPRTAHRRRLGVARLTGAHAERDHAALMASVTTCADGQTATACDDFSVARTAKSSAGRRGTRAHIGFTYSVSTCPGNAWSAACTCGPPGHAADAWREPPAGPAGPAATHPASAGGCDATRKNSRSAGSSPSRSTGLTGPDGPSPTLVVGGERRHATLRPRCARLAASSGADGGAQQTGSSARLSAPSS